MTTAMQVMAIFSANPSSVPKVVISNPINNTVVSSPSLSVSGTANDPDGISSVQYSLNGTARQTANGTTNFSFNVTLASGQNFIGIFAKNSTGYEGSAQITVHLTPPASITSVPVTVAPSVISSGQSATLVASVTGTGAFDPAVTWSIVSGGGILSATTGASVFYTAPIVSASTTVIVKATSVGDSSKAGTATLIINPTTGSLAGTVTSNGSALPGVVVSSGGSSQTTGSDGKYTLTGLPAGQIGVSFTKSGYETQSKTATIIAGQTTTLNVALVSTSLPSTITAVGVNPSSATLFSAGTQTLSATVSGTGAFNPAINWSIVSGAGSLSSISGSTVTYSAPNVTSTATITIRATSVADPSKSATATLTINPIPIYGLTVSKIGSGTVLSNPAGINCGSDCSESYPQGTFVILSATPGSGFAFDSWSGACAGTGTCTLNLTNHLAVTATFRDNSAPSVSIASPANGAVVSSGTVTVTGNLSDNVGVTQVQYSLNSGSRQGVAASNPFSFNVNLNQGSNTIRVFAQDAAGNEGSQQIGLTYTPPPPDCGQPGPSTGSTPVTGDFSENAAKWCVDASDHASTVRSADSSRAKIGSTSLKLSTQSGFDVRMSYPSSRDAGWNLTGHVGLRVWVYAENANTSLFQNSSPWIRLGKGTSYFQYQASRDVLNDAIGNWVQFTIPLAGDATWGRTQSGSVSLSQIDWLEIHADTWEYGFNLWLDGLEFYTAAQQPSFTLSPQYPQGSGNFAIAQGADALYFFKINRQNGFSTPAQNFDGMTFTGGVIGTGSNQVKATFRKDLSSGDDLAFVLVGGSAAPVGDHSVSLTATGGGVNSSPITVNLKVMACSSGCN